MHAALLVDNADRTFYATEYAGAHDLMVSRFVGRNWRELFAGFDEIQIESQATPDMFFFVRTGSDPSAYRVRKWGAAPLPGEPAGHFVLIEAVGEPTAVRELIYHERMAALGQIAGGIAHEVNNPLTTISGWLQILLSQTHEDDRRRAALQLMSEEVSRIANTIHHLLTFGRRTPDEHQPVQVNRLLLDVLALVEYQIRNENIEIVTELRPELPPVVGDANQIKQVFLNIIVNARQAMPNGGALALSTDVSENGSVEIAFSDTGCGIPAEALQKVFDPFYTTKADRGGSGIGLFLCRNIVKDHGGTLSVASRPGEGSTFIIALPAAQVEDSCQGEGPADAFAPAVRNREQGVAAHMDAPS